MQRTEDGWLYFDLGIQLGFNMIPGQVGSKEPYIKWKAFEERKASPQETSKWKRQFKTINPILVTGKTSRLIVLDVDGPEGYETLSKLGQLPTTVMAQSPGGPDHDHYYFDWDPGLSPAQGFVRGYKKELAGLDLRADGNYIMFPGSLHRTGGRYTFKEGYGFSDVKLSPPPLWLIDYIKKHKEQRLALEQDKILVREMDGQFPVPGYYIGGEPGKGWGQASDTRMQKYAAAALRNQVQELANTNEGRRNDQLFKAAAGLATFVRNGFLNGSDVEQDLEQAAGRCGLIQDDGRRSVERTIRSGLEAGYADPLPDLKGPKRDTNHPRDVPRSPLDYRCTDTLRKKQRRRNI